jgi:hypothetical protein
MNTRVGLRPAWVALLVGTLVAGSGLAASAASSVADPAPRRDEFGVVPEDNKDKDLSLPDPVLDRTWPSPNPGAPDARPEHVAPDENQTDPFKDDEASPPLKPPPYGTHTPPGQADDEKPAPKPQRLLVAPDGKYDVGSPSAEPEPDPPDALEPDVDDPSEIEKDDARPSPLDKDDEDFDEESDDPGEW